MLPRDRHTLAADVFHRVVELGPGERAELMARLHNDDPELADEIDRLLVADERNSDGFLDAPLLEQTPNLLDQISEDDDAPDDNPPLPTTIGPYRITQALGEGEETIVCLAEQVSPVRRQVAIKLLRSVAARRQVLRRFELERSAIAMMDHPNIARLFEAGTAPDGRAYFVMEFVPGEPLTEYARSHGLTTTQRLELFLKACRAVEHAHQRGIIHRDIKPSNILAGDDHEAPHVKVIDFGISKALAASQSDSPTVTIHGQVVGTPGYMAPEQLEPGDHLPDVRTDIYALGAVLYELLCGKPAMDLAGMDPGTAIGVVMARQPRPLGGVDPTLKGDLEAIATRALQKDPSHRYRSVTELRDDIERYMEGRPVLARRAGLWYTLSKLVRRNVAAVCALAALVVVAILGTTIWINAQRAQYRLAVEIARSMVDKSLAMARTVGERAQRRPMLDELDQQSRQLAKSAPGDPGILEVRAAVLGALGDVDLEEAQFRRGADRLAEALLLRRELAQREPDSMTRQMDYSIALVRTGDAAKELNQREMMRDRYEQAMRIDDFVAAQMPENSRALSNLAWSCDRLGHLASEAGDAVSARGFFSRQLELMTRMRGLAPRSADVLRGVSTAQGNLAMLAESRGDTDEWERRIRASYDAAQEAARCAPSDRLTARHAISASIALAGSLMRKGDSAKATELIHKAVADAVALTERDRQDFAAKYPLIAALDLQRELLESRGEIAEAKRCADAAHAEADSLSSIKPLDPQAGAIAAAMASHARRLGLEVPRP